MMLSRRSVVSSCNSSSQNQHDHPDPHAVHPFARLHRLPHIGCYNPLRRGWPSAATADSDGSGDGDGDGFCSARTGHDDGGNAAHLPASFAGKKKRVEPSSGGSKGSLMATRPLSPSPICSPVSSFSCSPPSELYYSQASTDVSVATSNQSSRSTSKKKESPEVGRRSKEEPRKRCCSDMDLRDDPHLLKLQREDPSFPLNRKKTGTQNSIKRDSESRGKGVGLSVQCASCDPGDAMDKERKLPAVVEEQEEIGRRREKPRLGLQHLHVGTRLYSDAGPADSVGSSGYESFDMESTTDEHPAWASGRNYVALPPFAYEDDKGGVEARLKQWKEATTVELVNRRLRKKEAEINEWEKMRTMKAKMVMREFEMKMDEKRAKALDKMQRCILTTHRKAEQKILKERASASRKASKLAGDLDRAGVAGRFLICR